MCTTICTTAPLRSGSAAGKGARGWFPVEQVTVAYDHPAYQGSPHALLVDFANYSLGADARVAVELDLEGGRALLSRLAEAIEAAEASGL